MISLIKNNSTKKVKITMNKANIKIHLYLYKFALYKQVNQNINISI